MSLPPPAPGLVIRYGFLWSHEAEKGALEAAKDRPCVIIVAVRKTEEGEIRVIVAPVTHSPPDRLAASIKISDGEAKKLGLDDGPHWVRADELNSFVWPGFDLRPIPGKDNSYAYGVISQTLYENLRRLILEIRKSGTGKPDAERLLCGTN